ncbi:glycosyltransferase family 4 protein [Runella sp. MFBS21]|uniref:glycosyltransferase family 4 protein n=1 Tax=Runella sp. MFBS21 TaxID=3034018 RepID=UPI0023F9CFEA|nr:glycosyltransferase family 4 protein [Runella sp. MFBS21]MDF7820400.1 glycosyltransferase family 4 protein [Runella sp. MFBS21]
MNKKAKQPKILVFSTQFKSSGGIESHLLEFCRHMSEADVLIDLVVFNTDIIVEIDNQLKKIVRCAYLGRNQNPFQKALWLFKTGLRLGFQKYDALYTNGQGNSIGWIGRFIRYRHWVHHHHTSGDEGDRQTWTKAYWETLQRVPKIIACSQRNAKEIGDVLQRNVETIPCFSTKISPAFKTTKGLHLGYFGRLIPEKGIDVLCRLSADTDCHDIHFHIWGEGNVYPPSFFLNYPRLIYHGPFRGRKELTGVIHSIDGFLLLSTNAEGLPICLLEVMSAGLPWLATDKGGILDIACDPDSTKVISHLSSYEKMKEAVLSFADDIRSGKTNVEKQLKLYEQKFSAPVLVSEWKKALRLSAKTSTSL